MATKTLNEINIVGTKTAALPNELSHVTKAAAELYLSPDSTDKVKDFLVRDTYIEGKVRSVVVGIKADGRIADSDSDYVGLPCPPYCTGGGKILVVTKPPGIDGQPAVDFIIPNIETQVFAGSYIATDKAALLQQIGAAGFLEINIVDKKDAKKTTKQALIALNELGRIMDNDNHLVALSV